MKYIPNELSNVCYLLEKKKKRKDSKMLLQISPRVSICHCPSSNKIHMYPVTIPFFLQVPYPYHITTLPKKPIPLNPIPSIPFLDNPSLYPSIHTIPVTISIIASRRNSCHIPYKSLCKTPSNHHSNPTQIQIAQSKFPIRSVPSVI